MIGYGIIHLSYRDLVFKDSGRRGGGGNGNKRREGWASTHELTWNESNPYTPLNNGQDFRDTGATYSMHIQKVRDRQQQQQHREYIQNPYLTTQKAKKHYMKYTGYHFHNFFTTKQAIQFKYYTYGHPHRNVYSNNIQLDDIHKDLA